MKKITILLLTIVFTNTLFAQHISEYYTFSQESLNSGLDLLVSGDIVLDSNSDGGEITDVAIGFDFEYAGTTYNTLTIGVNGAITFTGNDVYGGNDLAGTATNVTDIIAPLWDDLYLRTADDGEIRTQLIGTAPNRIFKIEWRYLSWWNAGSTFTFHLWLYEGTNDIEFRYGAVTVEETGGEIGASIGLNAGTSGDNFISVTPGNPATTSIYTANNSIMPSEYNDYTAWKIYKFSYGPHNDACENAIVINNLENFSNTQIMNGTDNNDGFITGCTGTMNDGVWYTFTPDYDGEITIEATTPDFDNEIGVFTGSCGNFTCQQMVDENFSGETENVVLNVIAGTQYWVNVGDWSGVSDNQETGYLTLNINYSPPANDLCADAQEINCGDVIDGNNLGATSSGTSNCGVHVQNKGVWYHFAPTNGGGITAIWTTADFDTKLSVFSGSCTSMTCLADDDDTNGNQPYVEIETLPETDYYIYVMGFGTSTGEFSLNLTCTPPVNDEASGAISMNVNAIGAGCSNPTTIWNSNGVTDSSPINGTPSCADYAGGDSWYKFVAPASGGIRLLRPTVGDWGALGYAIYNTETATTPLVCNDIMLDETQSDSFTGMNVGSTYWLRIWEWNNNDFGSIGICLEEVESGSAATNDLSLVRFNYYPNPVKEILHVSAQENITQISIYNMLGQEVINLTPTSTSKEINISNLANGTYFIKAQVGDYSGTYKFIKQ